MSTEKRDKMYSSRRAVVATLRRMGIKVGEYDKFITKMGSKQFVCHIVNAEEYAAECKAQVTKAKSTKKPKATRKADRPETISGLCRRMICDGHTNDEIFQTLQDTFGKERFGPSKSQYPVWYRCELRRNKKLPPAFDVEQRDKTAIHVVED